jgi:hypothetical protein
MFPEEKVNAIRNHLKSEFPNHEIVSDEGLDFVKFRLTSKGKRYLINFEGSFIDDRNPSELANYLQRRPFSWLLHREDSLEVVVTSSGRQMLVH